MPIGLVQVGDMSRYAANFTTNDWAAYIVWTGLQGLRRPPAGPPRLSVGLPGASWALPKAEHQETKNC